MKLPVSSNVQIFSATLGYISFPRKLTGLHATDVLRTGRSAGAVLCWMVPHTMYREHTKAHVSGPASRYSRTTQCRNECTCLAVTRPILQLGHVPIIKSAWIHTYISSARVAECSGAAREGGGEADQHLARLRNNFMYCEGCRLPGRDAVYKCAELQGCW